MSNVVRKQPNKVVALEPAIDHHDLENFRIDSGTNVTPDTSSRFKDVPL